MQEPGAQAVAEGVGRARPAREHDIDWRPAVAAVVWMPSSHRVTDVPEVTARRLLACTPTSFAQLVDLGLPFAEGPEGRCFDRNDLQNVALLSGTGLTDVERGMRLVLAFMQASRADLTRPRRWSYELRLLSDAAPGERLLHEVYRPMPEVTGGAFETCVSEYGRPAEVDGPFVRMPEGTSVAGTFVTVGKEQRIRSEAVNRVVADVLESGVRWHYMPETLATDGSTALSLGVGTCRTLSIVLAQRLLDAGYEARAYRGWMIALSDVAHGWVEVVDDDGVVKWIDPSFALLATAYGFGSEEFRDFSLGSTANRVVPTRAPAAAPLQPVRFVCRAVSDAAQAGRVRRRWWPGREAR